MNFLKLMPAALLMSLSLNAFAQDEDALLDEVTDEESTEVVASTPTDKKFFQRVQLGYTGTAVNFENKKPDENTAVLSEKYFLSGITFGWAGDLRIDKDNSLFLEVGANLGVHVGTSKDKNWNVHHDAYYRYKVKAFTVEIPVSINKQFKDAFGVENLTLAPFAGFNFRFNVMAKRKATDTFTEYVYNEDGSRQAVPGSTTKTHYTASLMSTDEGPDQNNYPEIDPKSRFCMKGISEKPHVGTLVQPGAQIGVNAFYKNFSLGLAYMYDLIPFAGHKSSKELTSKSTPEGGNLPQIGTGCDMKISTAHNFLVTVGYVF